MTIRVVGFAAAIIVAVTSSAPAWAQAEHAQRIAMEVAVRRAQVAAAMCRQQAASPAVRAAPLRLPNSPPVGTAGPVAMPACASAR